MRRVNKVKWKTLGLLATVIVAIAVVAGCSLIEGPTTVQFVNRSSDAVISYGIRVGDASYVGTLNPGQSTTPREITPGEYALETMNGSAQWSPVLDVMSWGGGNSYVAGLSGSFANPIFFREVN